MKAGRESLLSKAGIHLFLFGESQTVQKPKVFELGSENLILKTSSIKFAL